MSIWKKLFVKFSDERGIKTHAGGLSYHEVRKCEIPFEPDGSIDRNQRLQWAGQAGVEQISESRRAEILERVRRELEKAGYRGAAGGNEGPR